jgi:hypothetical protein
MKRNTKSTLIGCGVVVAAMAAVAMLAFGSMVWSVFGGYGRALDTREQLETTYDSQADFTPAPNGAISQDRMQAFLAVRTALMPQCQAISEHHDAFKKIFETDNTRGGPPPPGFFGNALDVVRRTFRIGGDFGSYIETRKQTLLDNEMGLGEYSWIYSLAYFSYLGQEPVQLLPAKNKPKVYEGRVFGQLRHMVQRHVENLQAELNQADGEKEENLRSSLEIWKAELTALKSDKDRAPFSGGLPRELEASLLPFRQQLEELACLKACELDSVVTVKKDGLGYDHE